MDRQDVPPVPARSAHRAERHRRRRSSLPPPSSNARLHANNHVSVAPASPEVISSLITSLSIISSPANEHFDSLPAIRASRSTPSSPNPLQTSFPTPEARLDYDDLLHPDDAAIPPVIRTSRPPSGFSPLTAGQASAIDRANNLKQFWKANFAGTSTGSPKDRDTANAIPLETDTPVRRSSTSSSVSAGSNSWKNGRKHKGLMYMSSKERLREKEAERKRAAHGTAGSDSNGLGVEGVDYKRNGSQIIMVPSMAEMVIKEETTTLSDSIEPDIGGIPGKPVQAIPDSPSPLQGHSASPRLSGANTLIPERNSSLSKTSPNPDKKRRSHRHNRVELAKKRGDEAERGRTKSPLRLTDGEDKVVERIRELRAQKTEREMKGSKPVADGQVQINQDTSLLSPRHSLRELNAASSNAVTAGIAIPDFSSHDSGENSLADTLLPTKKLLSQQSSNSKSHGEQGGAEHRRKTSLSKAASMLPQRSNSFIERSTRAKERNSTGRPQRNSNPLSDTQSGNFLTKQSQDSQEERPTSSDSIDDSVDRFLNSPRLSQKIRNPETGRTISFSEVGDPDGFAVFCCVGMGLTRYITAFYDELARTLKLRLITPDRPGVGESEPYAPGTGTPLNWPEDVYLICSHLKINKFSILAHSAGAIYALATALRMPQHIRGRIHLLAPWIPPSQMSVIGSQQQLPPAGAVPTSQKILRALPTPILKAANSSFMSATSASITRSVPKSPRRTKRRSTGPGREFSGFDIQGRNSLPMERGQFDPNQLSNLSQFMPDPSNHSTEAAILAAAAAELAEKERQAIYDQRLTHAIWDMATTNANPAVDLLICLERGQTIGFRYVDINRAVVIHHGTKDTRVPVENVRWLGTTMRRCEVRVLEGEGHGLMASATVMGSVLMEIAKEWEDWTSVVRSKGEGLMKKYSSGDLRSWMR